MSTDLKIPLPATKIQVGEIRANLFPTPTAWSRVAYVSDDGNTIGDTTFSAWSKESWELLIALTEQVEKDLAAWMESKSTWTAADTEEAPAYEEDDGLDFSG
ncbi:MAG: hypothetical protein VXZ72_00550 [Chlamydiota bacterium]|nr:hypothetical protein [Chlamydiota bacterium]